MGVRLHSTKEDPKPDQVRGGGGGTQSIPPKGSSGRRTKRKRRRGFEKKRRGNSMRGTWSGFRWRVDNRGGFHPSHYQLFTRRRQRDLGGTRGKTRHRVRKRSERKKKSLSPSGGPPRKGHQGILSMKSPLKERQPGVKRLTEGRQSALQLGGKEKGL